MYCINCGEQIGSKVYCPSCGTRSAQGVAVGAVQVLPPMVTARSSRLAYSPPPLQVMPRVDGIRQNLTRFRVFEQNVTCPNCGYFGPMGVVRENTPFYANCFVLALLVITMVGLAVVLLLAILGRLSRTHVVHCPQCGAQFEIR